MELCNIDEESEIVARICCCIIFFNIFHRQPIRNPEFIYLLLEYNWRVLYIFVICYRTVLNVPMNNFLTIFNLNTQEIWKEIFKKYGMTIYIICIIYSNRIAYLGFFFSNYFSFCCISIPLNNKVLIYYILY